MKGSRAAIIAVVAVVLAVAAWWFFTRRSNVEPMALIPLLESARKSPAAGTFQVANVDLSGESKQAIEVPPNSRLTYKVRIPDDAWLRVSVGARPESWTAEGNGTLFLVGVSDGKTFDELFTQHVNPFGNAGDRKWIQVWVDLSPYAGEEVDLIFNARDGPAKQEGDVRNDAPLWGAPEIVVR